MSAHKIQEGNTRYILEVQMLEDAMELVSGRTLGIQDQEMKVVSRQAEKRRLAF